MTATTFTPTIAPNSCHVLPGSTHTKEIVLPVTLIHIPVQLAKLIIIIPTTLVCGLMKLAVSLTQVTHKSQPIHLQVTTSVIQMTAGLKVTATTTLGVNVTQVTTKERVSVE